MMRRTSALLIAVFTLAVPQAAFACTTCGNHGDTIASLYVFGVFMTVPWILAGTVAWFIRKQVRYMSAPSVLEVGIEIPLSS